MGNVLWLTLNSGQRSFDRLQTRSFQYRLNIQVSFQLYRDDESWRFLRFCTVFANCAALALKLSSRQEPQASGIPALAYFQRFVLSFDSNGQLIHDVSIYVLIDFVWDRLRQLNYRTHWKYWWYDNYLLKGLGHCCLGILSCFCVYFLTVPWRLSKCTMFQLPTNRCRMWLGWA